MVEIFFSRLTEKTIRRGIFHSVPALITAIQDYLAAHNENPEPFKWTATTDQILEKVRRGRVHPQHNRQLNMGHTLERLVIRVAALSRCTKRGWAMPATTLPSRELSALASVNTAPPAPGAYLLARLNQ